MATPATPNQPGADQTAASSLASPEAVLQSLGIGLDAPAVQTPEAPPPAPAPETAAPEMTPEELAAWAQQPDPDAAPAPEAAPATEAESPDPADPSTSEPEAAGEPDPLQARIEELEARLAEFEGNGRPSTPPSPAGAPVPAIMYARDEADLQSQVSAARQQIKNWELFCLRHPDGCTAEEGGGRAYSADDIAQLRASIPDYREALREELIPQAQAKLEARQKFAAQTRQRYPDVFRPNTAASKIYRSMIAEAPWALALWPALPLVVGAAAAELSRQSRQPAARPTPKPGFRPAPRLPGGGGAPPTTRPKAPALSGGFVIPDPAKLLERGGTAEVLADLLKGGR